MAAELGAIEVPGRIDIEGLLVNINELGASLTEFAGKCFFANRKNGEKGEGQINQGENKPSTPGGYKCPGVENFDECLEPRCKSSKMCSLQDNIKPY